jgi:hypothetical protein
MKFTYGDQDKTVDKEGWPHWFKNAIFKKPLIINGYEINDLYHEDYLVKKERKGVVESDDDFMHDLPDAK